MTARAVLIGAETYGLSGCDADVALVDEMLRRRDFETECLSAGGATRDEILGAIDTLIADTSPGDAAVVYFSGHGGRLARPDADERKAAGRSAYFQFLVPADMQDSSPGDFRGVLAEELAIVQRRLAEAFAGEPVNATTILDCCHSGYMARNTIARPRSVDLQHEASRMFTIRGILDHVRSLEPDADVAAGSTNPHIVRMTACQAEQSAFELPSHRGGTHGVFTDALVAVLDEIGDTEVSWAIVGDLVRRRVRSVVPEQRPEIEGPAARSVFGASIVDDVTALPIVDRNGTLAIEAATLLGLAPGDQVRLVVPGTDRPPHVATVTELQAGNALLDASPTDVGVALGSVIAVPGRISVPPIEVSVGDGAGRSELVDAIEASPRLTVGEEEPIVRLEAVGERWRITDSTGVAWRTALLAADAAGVAETVDGVEAIAMGHRLLDLPGGVGPAELPHDVEIAFATVVDGRQVALPPHGERIRAGTPVSVSLRNNSSSPRYFWLFDVGVSGRSELVTHLTASGWRLGPTGDEDDFCDVWGPTGQALYWPPDVPHDPNGRPESFVLIIADRRNDLSGLASRSPVARGGRSPLDLLLDEVRVGTREVPPAGGGGDDLRYRIERLEFVLIPST